MATTLNEWRGDLIVPGPVAKDVVLRRDGAGVSLAQVPGLPQMQCQTFAAAVRLATAFAAVHSVDVWCAVGRHWSLVATYREHVPGLGDDRPARDPVFSGPLFLRRTARASRL